MVVLILAIYWAVSVVLDLLLDIIKTGYNKGVGEDKENTLRLEPQPDNKDHRPPASRTPLPDSPSGKAIHHRKRVAPRVP